MTDRQPAPNPDQAAEDAANARLRLSLLVAICLVGVLFIVAFSCLRGVLGV